MVGRRGPRLGLDGAVVEDVDGQEEDGQPEQAGLHADLVHAATVPGALWELIGAGP